ncbi:MAG TPA: hypothetical protein DCR13_05710 [Gammaproteobacteria bacterium]|nr:hypothetical protein [Gammaproteobacteria bacterium]HAU06640.1 hypothetical protein [Gammaproteobacteria bacterium]
MSHASNIQQDTVLIDAFSSCFSVICNHRGKLPDNIHHSHEVAGIIIGISRGFAIQHSFNEKRLETVIETIFHNLFHQRAKKMINRAETLLHHADERFMFAYLYAKKHTLSQIQLDLSWLSCYVEKHFMPKMTSNKNKAA